MTDEDMKVVIKIEQFRVFFIYLSEYSEIPTAR